MTEHTELSIFDPESGTVWQIKTGPLTEIPESIEQRHWTGGQTGSDGLFGGRRRAWVRKVPHSRIGDTAPAIVHHDARYQRYAV